MITPFEDRPALARAIGLKRLILKREDLHPYGSHKGRSIPPMIDKYRKAGDRRFAVSSSGNAALAAARRIVELPDCELDIFVGNHIAEHKLAAIAAASESPDAGGRIRVFRKERPLQALTMAAEEGARSLRQSTDDSALDGYSSLAHEIAELSNSDPVGAVFIGTSSGTTAQALATYFLTHKLPIQVHLVQTSSCHPIADAFDTFDMPPHEVSTADAIVDRTAYRKATLIPLIQKTGGRGWCATNADIESARSQTETHAHITISPNSALSVAGAMQAAYMGYEIHGAAVCLICGE